MSAAGSSDRFAESSHFGKTRILLLEDDVYLAEALKELLEERDFAVTTVRHGVAGLRALEQSQFDVIVCDMVMPQMDGNAFYRAVQKLNRELSRRFIFVTGYSEKPKVNSFLQQIGGRVIYKPVLMEELLRMIALVLKYAEPA